MGTVLAVIKILPEDTEVNLEEIRNTIKMSLPNKYKYHDSKIEPFVYGLQQLKMSFTMDDKSGGTDQLEELIREIKGVTEVEVEHVSLI